MVTEARSLSEHLVSSEVGVFAAGWGAPLSGRGQPHVSKVASKWGTSGLITLFNYWIALFIATPVQRKGKPHPLPGLGNGA